MKPIAIECTIRRWKGKRAATIRLSKNQVATHSHLYGMCQTASNAGEPTLSISINDQVAVMMEGEVLELMAACVSFLKDIKEAA